MLNLSSSPWLRPSAGNLALITMLLVFLAVGCGGNDENGAGGDGAAGDGGSSGAGGMAGSGGSGGAAGTGGTEPVGTAFYSLNPIGIFSVPFGGGDAEPVRVSPPAAEGGEIRFGYQVTADGERVVYESAQDDADTVELYVANADGTGNRKLNLALPDGGRVWNFKLTPDGERVIYRAEQDTDDQIELYSTRLDGTGSVKLNGPLEPGETTAFEFECTPDGSQVVFVAGPTGPGDLNGLFVRNVDGSGEVIPLFADGQVTDFKLSPDGTRVLFRVFIASADAPAQLYAINLDGTQFTRINGDLPKNASVSSFCFTPDGTRVIYTADQDTFQTPELYSSDIFGLDNVKLNAPTELGVFDFEISPDSGRVVYEAFVDGARRIFATETDNNDNVVPLTEEIVDGGGVFDFKFTPDGSRLLYRADQEIEDAVNLYAVTLDGTTTTRLGPALERNGEVRDDFKCSRDGSRVFYRVRETRGGKLELFRTDLDGTDRVNLSPPLEDDGGIGEFLCSEDGSWVVYVVSPGFLETNVLFASPVEEPSPRQISGPPVGGPEQGVGDIRVR
ncbi:MAG: hypothetical protein AAF500_15175 [Myxococcota bacterium]